MGKVQTVKLNDGHSIPVIAFGTGQPRFFLFMPLELPCEHSHRGRLVIDFTLDGLGTSHAWTDTSTITTLALSAGHSHFDCGWHYKNQHHTGSVLAPHVQQHGRDSLYVATKAGDFDGKPEDFDARMFLSDCLRDVGPSREGRADAELKLDYVDLFLVRCEARHGLM